MPDPSLFELPPERGLARRDGPATMHAAAGAIASSAATLRARVLAYLRRNGPATDEQIQAGLGMAGNTERPRRVELVRGLLVVDSGQTGKTKAGRPAVMWKAAEVAA